MTRGDIYLPRGANSVETVLFSLYHPAGSTR